MKKTINKDKDYTFILNQLYQININLTSNNSKTTFSQTVYQHIKYIILDIVLVIILVAILHDVLGILLFHMSLKQTWLFVLAPYLHMLKKSLPQ